MSLPDVCVVGAGPAGLACAIGAAMRGLRVRVVDAAPAGPVDKACGEGLLPDALACLERMGVRAMAGRRIDGIRFHAGSRVAQARFMGQGGLGVRRTELHRAMLARARELGMQVEWGTALRSLDDVRAGVLIGADGGQSRVRALTGLHAGERLTTRRIGLRQHFAVKPWSEYVEVFWTDAAQAYVTPVGEHEVGVAFLSDIKLGTIAEALERFPELKHQLAGASATSTPRGASTVTRRLRHVTKEGVALVGDASGAVDAITGEGMNLCFRQAEILCDALADGDLRRYEAAHTQTMRLARVMSSALLAMGRYAPLRSGAMAVLSSAPGIFAGLLNIHAAGDRASHGRQTSGQITLRSVDAGS